MYTQTCTHTLPNISFDLAHIIKRSDTLESVGLDSALLCPQVLLFMVATHLPAATRKPGFLTRVQRKESHHLLSLFKVRVTVPYKFRSSSLNFVGQI